MRSLLMLAMTALLSITIAFKPTQPAKGGPQPAEGGIKKPHRFRPGTVGLKRRMKAADPDHPIIDDEYRGFDLFDFDSLINSLSKGDDDKYSFGRKLLGYKKKPKRTESYSFYRYKVLKQVHPDSGISPRQMSIINSFINDVFARINVEANNICRKKGRTTPNEKDRSEAIFNLKSKGTIPDL